MAEPTIRLQIVHPKSDVEDLTCPYCLDHFQVGQAVLACPNPQCGMLHHAEHWEENDNRCASPYGCSGAGIVDWINPLDVAKPAPVEAAPVADWLSSQAASLFGVQAVRLENVALFRAFSAEGAPAFQLAVLQFVMVTILFMISKGAILQNSLIRWQYSWISRVWPWLVIWVAIVLASTLLVMLTSKPRFARLGQVLRLIFGILIWLFIVPAYIELFYFSQYLWPLGIGKFFVFFGWGRFLLGAFIFLGTIYLMAAALAQASAVTGAILVSMRVLLLSLAPWFVGIVGIGLLAEAGIQTGGVVIHWIFGGSMPLQTLLTNGLTVAMNVTFVLAMLVQGYGEVLTAVRAAIRNRQQQQEMTSS
jgi:hypothetical protein